jgi:aspartyl-tRNA(Asn)/glutamyl-tRNA(Gln) amidotransferase subunit B
MMTQSDTITPIIGLEIHVELATRTKMFCRCRNHFGDPPNTNVCPVCTSLPGSLPVMNRQAVAWAMKVGLALHCTVPDYTKWDRKNYYYPDLPKGYQISQYDLPLARDGRLDVPLESGETFRVRILRAHLEEDAGKNTHDIPGCTGVDLNRAGVPLLEIVSEPDIHSAEQAGAYGRAMQRLVRWLGVSEANMQMGHMRFEPNINLHIQRGGQTYKTPIVEVKNLNSFRSLEGAVAFEIARQYEQWQADPEGFSLKNLGKQNRGYDVDRERTVFQREKEEAHDYRYFPDPDLPAVIVSEELRTKLRSEIPELPLARRSRFIEQLGLSFVDADALTQDRAGSDLFDRAVELGGDAKRCVNLLLGRGAALAKEREVSLAELGVSAEMLAELATMLAEGTVNATAGETIFVKMVETGETPGKIAKDEGLETVQDTAQLEAWIDEAIANHAPAVEEVRSGGKKADKSFNFLVGQVMRASRGAAPPRDVQRLLREKIGG